MKKRTTTGLYRLVLSIALIAMLVAVVGIAVDGWQLTPQPSDQLTTQQPPSTDAPTTQPTPPPTIYIPPYINYLTGLETTAELSTLQPLAVLLNTDTYGHGLSYASVTMEFPLENGQTRTLAFIEDPRTLGQIGTVAPVRQYMADMLHSFGGLLVSYGSDDRISYNGYDMTGKHLDLSQKSGSCYTEGIGAVYTNGYLLSSALNSSSLVTHRAQTPAIPFRFTDFGSDAIRGENETASVYLQYSKENTTKFIYNESKHTYTLYKNDQAYTDVLKQGDVSYTNVFILFADTTTYERTDMTQTVMDTTSGGGGYYMSEGTSMRISWKTDQDGVIQIYDASGQPLTVNRGSSYISFFKSSLASTIHFG